MSAESRASARASRVALGAIAAVAIIGAHFWYRGTLDARTGVISATSHSTSEIQKSAVDQQLDPTGTYQFVYRTRATTARESLVDVSFRGNISLRRLPGQPTELVVTSRIELGDSLPAARVRLDSEDLFIDVAIDGAESASLISARMARIVAEHFRYFGKFVDEQGTYDATVSAVAPNEFVKTKLRYRNGSYAMATITASKHFASLDSHGYRELRGHESLRVGESGLAVNASIDYRIKRVATGPDRDLASGGWKSIDLEGLAQREIAANAQANLRATGPSFSETLARLNRQDLPNAAARLDTFRRLVSWLEADPTRIAEVTATLRDAQKASPPRADVIKSLIGALASVKHPDADRALREVFRDEAATPTAFATRSMILNAWATTEAPATRETTQLIREVAEQPDSPQNPARQAWLALGAQTARANDAQLRAELETALVAKYRAAHTDAERAEALESIGNSGAASLFALVREGLGSADERTRSKAYLALRFMKSENVDGLLTAGLHDPSPHVRRAVQLAQSLRR